MTVENPNTIDGIGLEPNQSAVVLLISDHLEWGDPVHLQLLGAKIEAYANAALSGELVQAYPNAASKPVRVQLVWQHEPDEMGLSFMETVRQQLHEVGIGFQHRSLPEFDETP